MALSCRYFDLYWSFLKTINNITRFQSGEIDIRMLFEAMIQENAQIVELGIWTEILIAQAGPDK